MSQLPSKERNAELRERARGLQRTLRAITGERAGVSRDTLDTTIEELSIATVERTLRTRLPSLA